MSRPHTRTLIISIDVEYYLADHTADDAADSVLQEAEYHGLASIGAAKWADDDDA